MNARTALAAAGLALLSCTLLGTADAQQPAKAAAERPVAVVGERTIGWSELAPLLAEAAGGQVLEEYALGTVLKEECLKRQIRIGDAETRAERTLLTEMLAKAARAPLTEGEGLLTRVRRTRGLGELRFKGLLERNAALRAMVRAGIGDAAITITQEDLDTAYDLKYGPRVRARLILVSTEAAAKRAAARIAAGESFAEVAGDVSLDPSASRGGAVDPFSLSDSTYPVAVRKALLVLKPGAVSEPLGVSWGGGNGAPEQPGFAIVRLDENIPAAADAPTKEAAAKDLEQEVRTVRERAAMDTLARKLLRTTSVSAMDGSLNWAWEGRGGGAGGK
jgi:parvulin-like peptidyl-prolyl isomerase